MMSGFAVPVLLIQMQLFFCVFLGRKSACKEKDKSLTEQMTFKSSLTTTRSTGRGLILQILRTRRRSSSKRVLLLVAGPNRMMILLCLTLLLLVCLWFLLLFISSASYYNLLLLLVHGIFFWIHRSSEHNVLLVSAFS
jgi:hypothetical protein